MGTKLTFSAPYYFIKASSGEGSRGGHIIGHTKLTGKPIYGTAHSRYRSHGDDGKSIWDHAKSPKSNGMFKQSDYSSLHAAVADRFSEYTAQDHVDAADAHEAGAVHSMDVASQDSSRSNKQREYDNKMYHPLMAIADAHALAAGQAIRSRFNDFGGRRNTPRSEAYSHAAMARIETERKDATASSQSSMHNSDHLGDTPNGPVKASIAPWDRPYQVFTPEDHRHAATLHAARAAEGGKKRDVEKHTNLAQGHLEEATKKEQRRADFKGIGKSFFGPFNRPLFVAYPPRADVAQTFVINKARTHKYISRERKGNRWVYTYAEPQTPHDATSHDAPAETVAQKPNSFESKATLEHPWTGVAMALVLKNLPKKDFQQGWFDHRKRTDAAEATVAFQKMGYRKIVEAVDNIRPGLSAKQATNGIAAVVSTLIDEARAQHLNGAADGFARYFNAQFAGRTKSSANAAPQHLEIAAREAGLTPESKLHAARLFVEGKSIDMAVGAALDVQNGGAGKVSLADIYKKKSKRIGPDNDAITTPQEALHALTQDMGVRDVSLGKTLSQEEKEHHLQQCALGLADLTNVLGLPKSMASFNGKLSLNVTASGRGDALATYNPNDKTITLKRDSGAGSLAHEWGHFFDNVVARITGSGAFLSTHVARMNAEGTASYAQSMTQGAMQSVFSGPDMDSYTDRLTKSPGYQRASAAQRRYLRSPEELWARVFEAHVAHKLKQVGQTNTYLVAEHEKDTALYPNDAEIVGISAAIDKVFETFKNSDLLHKAIRYFFSATPAPTFTIPSKG